MAKSKSKPKKKSLKSRRAFVEVAAPSIVVGPTENQHATKEDRVARCNRAAELMEQGMSSMRAARTLAKECAISFRQAKRYTAIVRARWSEMHDKERPEGRAKLLHFLESVAHGAYCEGDWKAAVGAAREIARVSGFDDKTVTVNGMSPEIEAIMAGLKLTPAQRKKRQIEIEAELAAEVPDEVRPPVDDETEPEGRDVEVE